MFPFKKYPGKHFTVHFFGHLKMPHTCKVKYEYNLTMRKEKWKREKKA
jgi:hypothetical protein